jgi:hypothetical protein
MLILVSSSPSTLLKDHGRHPNLGVLSTPSRVYMNVGEWPWGADNEAFTNFDAELYIKMLGKIKGMQGCLFVTAPDVVGDAKQTLLLFDWWVWKLQECAQPIAIVGQDGLQEEDVPWDTIDSYFVGGSSEWKLGEESARLVRAAKERGKWVHMGRVNTQQRIKYAKAIGCDSADGSKFSKWRKTYLDIALAHASDPVQESAAGVW